MKPMPNDRGERMRHGEPDMEPMESRNNWNNSGAFNNNSMSPMQQLQAMLQMSQDMQNPNGMGLMNMFNQMNPRQIMAALLSNQMGMNNSPRGNMMGGMGGMNG